MVAAGIIMEEEDEETEGKSAEVKLDISNEHEDDFSIHTLTELNKMLKSAVESEEYEKASKVRDEINKRKQGS